jgi:hypothetical protein
MVKLVKIFPALPALVLAEVVGVRLPAFGRAAVIAADVTLVFRPAGGDHDEREQATEAHGYNSDQVVAYCDATGGQALWLVVWEPQFGFDGMKIFRWPQYLANSQADQQAHAVLLVYCPSAALVRRYRDELAVRERSLRTQAYFLVPDLMPRVDSADNPRARTGMAALSAFCRRDQGEKSFDGCFGALLAELWAAHAAGPLKGTEYYEMVRAGLPGAAAASWERLVMKSPAYEFISEEYRTLVASSEAKGKAEGKVEGKAEGVLRVLAARQVTVPADARAQILACTDPDLLDTWLARAANASRISDVTGTPRRPGRRWRRLGR